MSKFQSYRIFDLVMLSVIAVFAEITSIVLGQLLPGAGFYVRNGRHNRSHKVEALGICCKRSVRDTTNFL